MKTDYYKELPVLKMYPHTLHPSGGARAEDAEGPGTVEADLGAEMEGSRTDDNVVAREEEAIKLDGLNVAQVRSSNLVYYVNL